MTGSPLSAAFEADANHCVCFAADGREKRWPELAGLAEGVAECLSAQSGAMWALDLDDSYEFACALLGCWAADKTAVIASSRMIADADSGVRIDGVIRSAPQPKSRRATVVLSDVPSAGRPLRNIDPDSGIILYTSGSTGTPKKVTRSLRNAEAEIGAFESLWGELAGDARVYSSVSHRHVYGLLFGVLWPLLSGRAFSRRPLEYPEQLLGPISAGNALVTSPALLKRIGHLPANGGEWRIVFSSGGLLPAEAAKDSVRVLGTCPIEVFGSTETSGVAWRRQQRSEASWVLLPNVDIRVDEDAFLEIRSPYSGQRDWLRMGDRARPSPAGSFELLGRGDKIAKIEDKRVSLTEIEQLLLESPYVVDAAAVALTDEARQCVAVAIQLSPDGSAKLGAIGRRAFADDLRNALRTRIDAVALPRKLRYVDEIPCDSQGKRTQAEVTRLFEES